MCFRRVFIFLFCIFALAFADSINLENLDSKENIESTNANIDTSRGALSMTNEFRESKSQNLDSKDNSIMVTQNKAKYPNGNNEIIKSTNMDTLDHTLSMTSQTDSIKLADASDESESKFQQKSQNMKIYLERRNKALKDMEYVIEREKKHTLQEEKLPKDTLQEGIINAKSQKDENVAKEKIEKEEFKSHLFLGLQGGITYTAVADNIHTLPTINIKFGYQDFLGISSRQFGFRIYGDAFVASNILLAMENNPLLDFIDSTFSATSMNADIIYEVNISKSMRYGIGGGFGVGYMTYHDEYWDRLNGFASNISLSTYISFGNRHKVELGFKSFFYHYGSYVTRKLDNVVNTPVNILSGDFAKPLSLTIGWTYVF